MRHWSGIKVQCDSQRAWEHKSQIPSDGFYFAISTGTRTLEVVPPTILTLSILPSLTVQASNPAEGPPRGWWRCHSLEIGKSLHEKGSEERGRQREMYSKHRQVRETPATVESKPCWSISRVKQDQSCSTSWCSSCTVISLCALALSFFSYFLPYIVNWWYVRLDASCVECERLKR